ncbi:MAG: hypothetical protein JW941_06065, partial [Candidatus Coatesbacteria bacterium]|nr:hypothetical protein [Candidatus Coatesbacteria bacterium]
MKKILPIGIAALSIVALWLVFTFSSDSSTTNASFVAPVYAGDDDTNSGGGELDSCTDACLYDVVVAQALPAWEGYCKIGLSVKHKEYNELQCCCHTADYIVVEISTTSTCDCDVPWICAKDTSVPGMPCGYDVYITPLFVMPNDTQFYYKFWDSAAPSTCIVT